MTTSEAAFARLHPDVQQMIVNTLGWTSLRPVQANAIPPVLAGDNTVILAPTAGGKTEAAFFPLMTRVVEEQWEPLSILYLSPIRALLNNQHDRLSRLFRLIGHDVGVWHGDISASVKKGIRDDPPSVLLTTPESLEAMLISVRTSSYNMFSKLRAVVIDEVHAFAGDDRGWHLLGVLNHLAEWAGRDLQRIGLSATVGNKAEIVDWLSRGSHHARATIDPPRAKVEPQVTLDWVQTAENAAEVIVKLHPGKRRLVFCDARLATEQITQLLRERGETAHVIHGSLSAEERRNTERTFAQGNPGVIVSTSALELGIDIGDLDHVIQIDAPFSVASFLQRMGRTGRRPGTTPNLLMLATDGEAFVRGAAILELWKRGFVESVNPPQHPHHVLGQQMLARALARPGETLPNFRAAAARFAALADEPDVYADDLLAFLREHEFLHTDGVHVGMGDEGERKFGYRHFTELVSVFTTPPIFKVFWATREIGDVHYSTFLDVGEGENATVILLAGRTWLVKDVDWDRSRAYVEPLKETGKTRWLGGGPLMSRALAEAHRAVLTGAQDAVEHWSKRAHKQMKSERKAFGFLASTGTTVVRTSETVELWTFAGSHANNYLAAALTPVILGRANPTGQCVKLKTELPLPMIRSHVDDVIAGKLTPVIDEDHPFLRRLKFHELLPPHLLRDAATARFFGNGLEELQSIGPFHIIDTTAEDSPD